MKRHLTQADILSIGQPQQLQEGEAIHLETQFLKLSPGVEQEILRQMSNDCKVPLDLNGMSMAESHGDPRIDPMEQFGHGDPHAPKQTMCVRVFDESDHEAIAKAQFTRLAEDDKALDFTKIDVYYLNWLRRILAEGEYRGDRTGTGTISLFGHVMMRADLRKNYPALTTKYVHFLAVDDELDWMKSGSSNIRSMKKNGTRIWDEWVIPGTEEYRMLSLNERIVKLSKEKQEDLIEVVGMMREDGRSVEHILEVQNLHLERAGIPDKELVAGELGRVYGTQWRYWEDTRVINVKEWEADPQGWQDKGYIVAGTMFNGYEIAITRKIDQITKIEKQIRDELLFQQGKLEKHSAGRRIILSGWNVAQLDEMALPPCHVLAQWYVSSEKDEDGKHFLDCEMYQRSGDMFLGIPFNMAQYSLLTCQLAHVTGMKARFFTHVIGDAHIYTNHVEQVKEQLTRDPFKYEHPQLEITGDFNSILEMKTGDCKLVNYQRYPSIKAPVAV